MNPPFAVHKLGHVVINVTDLERSKRFYQSAQQRTRIPVGIHAAEKPQQQRPTCEIDSGFTQGSVKPSTIRSGVDGPSQTRRRGLCACTN